MSMDSITIYNNLLDKSPKTKRNIHNIERYVKFIFSCIEKNKNLSIDLYSENHHILPKSLYPEYKNFKENSWNKVTLTPRQHFIAHWLLARSLDGTMWYGLLRMKTSSKFHHRNIRFTSRVYEELRNNLTCSNETKQKISKARTEFLKNNPNPHKGMKRSKTTGDKIRAALLGNKQSSTTKSKRAKSISQLYWFTNGFESKRLKPEQCPIGWKRGRHHSSKGHYQPNHSDDTKNKMRESKNKTPKKECKYCKRLITPQNIKKHEKVCEEA